MVYNILFPQATTTTSNSLATSKSPSRSINLYDNYIVKKELGVGGSAIVHEIICMTSRKSFACKALSKQRYEREKIFKEIKFLRDLNHTNIIKYHEFYENTQDMFIVMEFAAGGGLFTLLKRNGKFKESSVKQIIIPLLKAVTYLHKNFIVHRDIKLENILLSSQIIPKRGRMGFSKGLPDIPEQDVKLVDFGLAKQLTSNCGHRTLTKCGSQFYVAPEVLLCRGYGIEVDMWGIGVVAYMLLTNTPPFYEDKSAKRLLRDSILSASYTLEGERFSGVSDGAKKFLKKCFILNPARRITSTKALNSSWIRSQG